MFYSRLSSIMFPIVSILLIGSAYWGYQEHQEKNAVLIKAENQYQRAFHDLTFHVEKLHQQLGNTLAVNSTSQGFHRKGLVNVWRLTSQAQNEINLLPLSFLPFVETEDFLSHISNFAYKTAVRDLTKQPLTEDEFKTLKELHAKSAEISKDLHAMQKDVLADNLRWMDVEIALASEQANQGNMIVSGLRSVDGKIGEYPELNWGPSVSQMYQKRSIKMLSGTSVTAEAIKQKAAQLAGADASVVTVTENAKGTEYASFSATITDQTTKQNVQMSFTEKGGQLTSYTKNRDVAATSLDFDKAKAAADTFLEKYGFKSMKAINYDQFAHTGTFTYVSVENDVLIYPEMLTVKIALDNGEPLGLQATDYVYERHDRTISKAGLTEQEAKETLNPNMEIREVQQALIHTEIGEEALCYEFTGQLNGVLYRVYINADTGVEESVELMTTTDALLGS